MMYHSDSRSSIEQDPPRAFVWLTLVFGLCLNLLPYPDGWFAYKPDFLALALAVWALRLRHQLPVSAAFGFGVLMDVAYTATLGQHAFAYCVLFAVASLFRRPYAIANHLHRTVFVLITLAATTLATLTVSIVFDDVGPEWVIFAPAAAGAAIWLFVPVFLSIARRGQA